MHGCRHCCQNNRYYNMAGGMVLGFVCTLELRVLTSIASGEDCVLICTNC